MTKEEIKQEIEQMQKQLEALLEKLNNQDDEVPDILSFEKGEKYYYMGTTGDIIDDGSFDDNDYTDMMCALNRRFFKTRAYAEMFSDKAQFIANLLHFKYLYDRDYKPNWGSENEQKFSVFYNNKTKQFEGYCSITYLHIGSVYFSTMQLAERCADWLNKLGGRK